MRDRSKINISVMMLIVIAVVLVMVATSHHSRQVGFHVDEVFADSSRQGKIVFGFVSVKKYDTDSLRLFAMDLMNYHRPSGIEPDTLPLIFVTHFYRLDDTVALDSARAHRIESRFVKVKNAAEKLLRIPGGYMYSDMHGHIPGLNFPRDTLFKTNVYIPKPGYNAKNLLNLKSITGLKTK